MGEFLRQFSSSLPDPNQSVDPNAGEPNQSVDPNAGGTVTTIPEVTVEGDPNAGQPNQPADPAAGVAASGSVQAAADTASAAVPAVSDTPPSAEQAAAPLPDPGILEEVEEAVVSGVRTIASAAPEVAEAAETTAKVVAVATVAPFALGAIAVGAAVGAAVLLWSSDAGAAWDGQINPETGKPYTSQEEYDRVQASLRDKRKNAQPLPPPKPGEDYDPDSQRKPQTPTCDSMFPGVPKCGARGGGFDNLADAENNEPDIGKYRDGGRVNVTDMSDYAQFPDGKNSHRTYYDKNGAKLFSLVKTPCCTDTPAGPVLTWRWSSAN
jgi:hypothetical protein